MANIGRITKVPLDIEAVLSDALSRAPLPIAVTHASDRPWLNAGAWQLFESAYGGDPNDAVRREQFAAKLSSLIDDIAQSQLTDVIPSESSGEPTTVMLDGVALPLGIAVASIPGGETAQFSVLTDMRVDRRAEDAVRRAEERFEHLVDSMMACVWILRRGHVIYANRSTAELFGVERCFLIGIHVSELFHAEDVSLLLANTSRVEQGESIQPHEYRAIARAGAAMVIELSSVSLEYDGDLASLCFARDVTERKREEQRLLQADRLSALGMLASGMAHSINNPLTYVLLNLDHLARRLPGLAAEPGAMADVMARLAEAREGAERMATIVKRMRSFARTDETTTRVLDLRTVLESVVELVGHEVHHRGRLTTRFENVPPVLANESKIEQICLGLLLFAAQMLPDDTNHRHEVRLSLAADERKFAVLEVICEGCTVTDTDLETLFHPFSTNDDGRLLGFGLNVCSGLVEQLGGQIEAEPLPGTGLLLRTAIPCVPLQRLTESKVTSSPPSSRPTAAQGKARVLVVDDDPGVGRALQLMLEEEHEVRSLARPREALQELLSDSGYDLIFCDLMMPELSGMDIYQVLRFNRPGYESRIVFMTGGAFTPMARRFMAQVPNQRIEKPFNLRSLQRLVQKSARRHP